jgi:hypothetical protein
LKGLLKVGAAKIVKKRQNKSLEDMAMIRVVQLGEKSPIITRKRIFRRLQSASRILASANRLFLIAGFSTISKDEN